MRVLFFIPYLCVEYGGTSKVVEELAAAIGHLIVEVDIVTTNAAASTKLDVPLEEWMQQEYYRVQYFSCWHHNDLILSRSLCNWLQHHIHDYDLIHTHTLWSPMVSFIHWLCQRRKIPYIVTPHGMLEPWILSSKAWKKKPYFYLLEKPALQNARFIQTIASLEANNIRSLGFSHTVTVPNGISQRDFVSLPDPQLFYQTYPETKDKALILFLSRLHPKKGLDLLASAFAKVRTQFKNAHLVVAGPDNINFLATVKQWFAEAGCLSAVTFTGTLTGEVKYAALSASNIYILPSYSEGFSVSILEAMAAGLPCVFTTGCNFPEAAEANAASVVPIDAELLADALIDLLANPQQATLMGERARQLILKNYTWESSAQQLVQIYRSILMVQKTSSRFQ